MADRITAVAVAVIWAVTFPHLINVSLAELLIVAAAVSPRWGRTRCQ